MKDRVEFRLVNSTDGTHYWTVFIPTQINKFKTQKEAEEAMALAVRRLSEGRFDLIRCNLNTGKEITYMGGVPQLLSKISAAKIKKGKRK